MSLNLTEIGPYPKIVIKSITRNGAVKIFYTCSEKQIWVYNVTLTAKSMIYF